MTQSTVPNGIPQSHKKMLQPKIENAEKTALKRMFFISVLFPISYFHSLNSLKTVYAGK